jgi:hypothetical protein
MVVYEEARRIITKVGRNEFISALKENCCHSDVEFSVYTRNDGSSYIKVGSVILPAVVLYNTTAIEDSEVGDILHFGIMGISVPYEAIEILEKQQGEEIIIEGTKFSLYVFLNRVEAIRLH